VPGERPAATQAAAIEALRHRTETSGWELSISGILLRLSGAHTRSTEDLACPPAIPSPVTPARRPPRLPASAHAAQIRYRDVRAIDAKPLMRRLGKAGKDIWDAVAWRRAMLARRRA
jgi:hypothetical protein